jgi:hypothetical protein
MSGVQNFVRGNQPAPASPRQDRLKIAQQAKISTKKTKSLSSGNLQPLASTAPAQGYPSNPEAGRNTFPQRQYQQQNGSADRGLFDETLTSELESTRSDIEDYTNYQGGPYNTNGLNNHASPEDEFSEDDEDAMRETQEAEARRARDYYDNGNDNAYANAQHQQNHSLRHQSSRSPLVNSEVDPRNPHDGSAIMGRFQQSQIGQNALSQRDMPVRSGQDGAITNQPRKDSRKRARDDEHIQPEILNQQQNLGPDEYELPAPQPNGPIQRQGEGGFDGSNVDETPSESPIDQHPQYSQDAPRDRPMIDLINASPDYDDQQLIKLKYQDLKGQTWENDPHAKSSVPARQEGDPAPSLEDRLKTCVDEMDAETQFAYFQHLSMAEWEETGEILIDRFGQIMKNMRLARQKRRAMVSDFEKKIEQREVLVRGKSAILGKKFTDMKKGGEGVLRGKLA